MRVASPQVRAPRLAREHVRGKVIVAFGHGTFQNALEVLLCSFGVDKSPADVFTRQPGRSHLRRGYPHEVYVSN